MRRLLGCPTLRLALYRKAVVSLGLSSHLNVFIEQLIDAMVLDSFYPRGESTLRRVVVCWIRHNIDHIDGVKGLLNRLLRDQSVRDTRVTLLVMSFIRGFPTLSLELLLREDRSSLAGSNCSDQEDSELIDCTPSEDEDRDVPCVNDIPSLSMSQFQVGPEFFLLLSLIREGHERDGESNCEGPEEVNTDEEAFPEVVQWLDQSCSLLHFDINDIYLSLTAVVIIHVDVFRCHTTLYNSRYVLATADHLFARVFDAFFLWLFLEDVNLGLEALQQASGQG